MPAPTPKTIYKVAPRELWSKAQVEGQFAGAPIDKQDGYIHFSTAEQLAETLAKHFARQDDLLLIAVPAQPLGDELRWEPSRGGDLFPHLYKPLQIDQVSSTHELRLDDNGVHILPTELASGNDS